MLIASLLVCVDNRSVSVGIGSVLVNSQIASCSIVGVCVDNHDVSDGKVSSVGGINGVNGVVMIAFEV